MTHQVKWTKQLTEDFIETAMLSDEEAYIMRSRVKGVSVTAQAFHLQCSESTVHRLIAKLKKKYDVVQSENPEKFPPRRKSAQETWMDEH